MCGVWVRGTEGRLRKAFWGQRRLAKPTGRGKMARWMDAKGRVLVKTQSMEEHGEGWNSLIVCIGAKGHKGWR